VKPSSNDRYLVDQNNLPFMILGDSPQSLIGRMSKTDATFYMTNRQRYGINTLWVNFLCNEKTFCNQDGTTFDGIPPFTTPGDISTPNPAYFERAEDMLKIAAAHGMTIMLDVAETAGWLDILRANGPEKAATFGRYVGNYYKNIPNIIWMYGNDFQTWRNPGDDAVVLAVAKGVKGADPNHIHTTELNYLTSGSLDARDGYRLSTLTAHIPITRPMHRCSRNTIGPSSDPSSWWRRTMSLNITPTPMAVLFRTCDIRSIGRCSRGPRDSSTGATIPGSFRLAGCPAGGRTSTHLGLCSYAT
jgi:hypothetical protein